MSDDDSITTDEQPDLATISSVGANCSRCGLWVEAPDVDAITDAMAEHMVQHYGPWPT